MASRASAGKVVDEIVRILEVKFQNTGDGRFNISEIIQGGSLGHGTAIRGKHDIDLVIYSRDVDPNEILQKRLKNMRLIPLKKFLETTFRVSCKMTQRSVQFSFPIDGGTLEVDLLVSPYYASPSEFYNFLKRVDPNDRGCLTVCAAKWQVQFFQRQPNEVKEYICRAKAWRDKMWDDRNERNGRPSSYLISLLVAKAYETRSPWETLTTALIRLVQDRSKDVFWVNGPSGDPRNYPSLIARSPPRVIDPANPANNVWESGVKSVAPGEKPSDYSMGDGQTALLVANIRTINLEKPL